MTVFWQMYAYAARRRWWVWGGYVLILTALLLGPPLRVGDSGEFAITRRMLIMKTAHLSSFTLLTILTGWLHVQRPWRWLLLGCVVAYAGLTEVGQYLIADLGWWQRGASLFDVSINCCGIALGLVISRRWWWA